MGEPSPEGGQHPRGDLHGAPQRGLLSCPLHPLLTPPIPPGMEPRLRGHQQARHDPLGPWDSGAMRVRTHPSSPPPTPPHALGLLLELLVPKNNRAAPPENKGLLTIAHPPAQGTPSPTRGLREHPNPQAEPKAGPQEDNRERDTQFGGDRGLTFLSPILCIFYFFSCHWNRRHPWGECRLPAGVRGSGGPGLTGGVRSLQTGPQVHGPAKPPTPGHRLGALPVCSWPSPRLHQPGFTATATVTSTCI